MWNLFPLQFHFSSTICFFLKKNVLHLNSARNCGMQNFKKMQYIFWRQKQALSFHRKHDFYFTVTFARKSKYPHRHRGSWMKWRRINQIESHLPDNSHFGNHMMQLIKKQWNFFPSWLPLSTISKTSMKSAQAIWVASAIKLITRASTSTLTSKRFLKISINVKPWLKTNTHQLSKIFPL